jgi:Tol biopolymer transport system component
VRRPLLIALVAGGLLLTISLSVFFVLQSQTTVVVGVVPTSLPSPRPLVTDASEATAPALEVTNTPGLVVPTSPASAEMPVPTRSASPTALVAADFQPVLFDDFSDLQSGWAPFYIDRLGNVNGYSAEGYMFDTALAGELLYDVRPDPGFIPIRFEVEIRSAEGAGRFGLMFDVQGDITNYSSLSYTAVTLSMGGEVALLTKVPGVSELQLVDISGTLPVAPNPGRPVFLAVERTEDSLIVVVDDVEVLRTPGQLVPGGAVGLIAEASGPLRVHFDNLLLSAVRPTEGSGCTALRLLFEEPNASPLLNGADVELVQRRLTLLGYNPGEIDGLFGPTTGAAVTTFQGRNGLEADGVVGPMTWCRLLSSDAMRADDQSEYAENAVRFRKVTLLPNALSVSLLVSVRGPEKLWQIALALPGKDALRYIDTAGDAFDPSYHPRTGLLAFTSLRTNRDQGTIWVLDTRSGEIWQASPPSLNSQFPVWSPDGEALLYTAEPLGGNAITARNYRYFVGSGENIQWSDEHAGWSDWARDGTVVFTRYTGHSYDIFIANGDGSGAVNLTNTDDFNEDIPSWSLDGSTIAFVRNPKPAEDDRDIFVMQRDGTNIRQLTTLAGPDSNPIWVDPASLVFAHQPSDEVRQPFVLDLAGNVQPLSLNEDRVWFMSRLDVE